MTDTGAAKLPGLPALRTGDPALSRWAQAVAEHLEVRAGARGNPLERGVTLRELNNATKAVSQIGSTSANPGDIKIDLGGGLSAYASADQFSLAIRNTALYKDLIKRLDDPTRFDKYNAEVRAILLGSIAEEAAVRGADISTLESKTQTATDSLAYRLEEITASVAGAAAGIRELAFASANTTSAQAGLITQVQARLDDVGGVTIEESMLATADRLDGLAGEYMVKINAGKAVASIGLSASEDPTGATESAFLVQADTFGVLPPLAFIQEGTPSATAIGQTWYQPSTKVYQRATATGTASWVAYTPSVPFGVDASTGHVYINGELTINAGGTALQDAISVTNGTRTAILEMYQWKATAPTTFPVGTSTYTWATGQFTNPATLNSWSATPPSAVAGQTLWICRTIYADTLTSATTSVTWSATAAYATGGSGTDGVNGQRVGFLEVYKWSATAPTTGGYPTGTSTYTWATGAFTAPSTPNGWSLTPGAAVAGQTLYGISVRVSDTLTTATSSATWNSTTAYAVGAAGSDGGTGTRGTIITKITGAWNATTAAAAVSAIATAAGATPTTPIKGDICYYTGGANECTVAGSPGTWAAVAAYIDGSLIVTGTLSASKISAGTITATGVTFSNLTGTASFGTGASAPYTVIDIDASTTNSWGINIGTGMLYVNNGINAGGNTTFAGSTFKVSASAAQFTGATYPTSGAGVDISYVTSTGYINSYDRDGAVYKPLYIGGSLVTINGGTGLAVATGFGCNSKTPQTAKATTANATDLATAIALVNNLKATLIANGICS